MQIDLQTSRWIADANMQSILFYSITIGLASGIFLRSFFVLAPSTLVSLIGVVTVFSAALFFFGKKKMAIALILFFICLLFGVWRYAISDTRPLLLDQLVEKKVEIVGEVVREPDLRSTNTFLVIDIETVNGMEAEGLVRVSADRFSGIVYGDYVSVSGTLKFPESFEGEFRRTFNYPGYLAAQGIHHTISFGEIEIVERGRGNPLLSFLYETKHTFMRSLESVIPEPEAGLGEGLVLGVKRAIGEELSAVFRTVGIIHIVVLSGYNITIVAEAAMRLLSFFLSLRARVIAGTVAIVLFMLLVGLSATVLRAGIMAVLVLFARATGKIYALSRALLFAATVMLLINPKLIAFDPGFQLSFLATLGLILIAPIIESKIGWVPSRFQVREFVTATLATQIMVLPLLLYSMGELSFVSVPVNVLVLVVVPFAMLSVFLSGLIGLVSTTLALPVAFLSYLVLGYILFVAELFARLPFASIIVPAFPFWVMALMYLILGGILFYILRKKENSIPILTELRE